MAELGVLLSFSRPRVRNVNADAESWFRTMKDHQSYPFRRFRDLLSVKGWVDGFVDWCKAEHQHSSIKYVTSQSATLRRSRLDLRHPPADL